MVIALLVSSLAVLLAVAFTKIMALEQRVQKLEDAQQKARPRGSLKRVV